MVKKLKEKGYRLKYLLIAINLPKSTYYFEINKIDAVKIRNKNIENKISNIYNNHKGRYGVRRVYRELLNQGYTINHKKVQRIMHELKLFGKRPREKYHSYKGKVGKIADNIIDRNFKADKPLQKWSTDISQFNFPWGKCYISPILDMYTNEIISYDLSLSPNLKQISNMLIKAFNKFPKINNLILHSDQGWQYQHKYYINELNKHGIIQSMSRKGNCYDNSIMETFFARLKNEVYYGYEKSYNSFEEFSKAIEKYIYYYNNERIQKKTKWMQPTKYRLASTTTN
ncbi:MAG: IS3 family transposase [Anaerococcus vaginalis]|uniref:IS3 family transposase n=1 Tax=Anaerococcus vaginalis TaxID=33037 RepID=UPI00290D5D24|nr:IS3 family transposase [Anaerococcus vaginalis]MDU7650037.1 IS3 family transposase [Anaerococcus vaginalis]